MLPAPMSEAPRRSDIWAAVQRSEAVMAEAWDCASSAALPVGLLPGGVAFADATDGRWPGTEDCGFAADDEVPPSADCAPLPLCVPCDVRGAAADEGRDAASGPPWQAVSPSAATAISDPAATRRPRPGVLKVSDISVPLVW
ncbi:hypothetical protein Scani_22320 [Streptomyces caniferus]|uniref:Uncharacterized protein n=1 Tax=Streptomyces caniferus TaxID=285557 RepID=A0A640S586_9ACTN|nr:hypothetical protein Scani_22320 [Streptomyces caniferus]